MARAGGSLVGKTAVVTGASRGIGLAIAARLASQGARVVLTARTRSAAVEAAASIEGQTMGWAAHSADEAQARACLDATVDRFGSIDILVNNAGTNPAYGPLVEVDRERFAKTLDVNVWAPVLWTGQAWRAWMRAHGGCVINTASLGAYVVGANLGAYNVSKAALVHVTRQLALELAPGVRVNALAPGVCRTKLASTLWQDREDDVRRVTPLGRIGEPEDVAEAALFLTEASWVTGQTITVDGGQVLVAAVGGDQPGSR
ncbi:SDR family oxidoreductase [Nocardioides acrostichi]|uniref:SDR family oxidoreductase n=1 Tax=Nocardioides acrostichi TaxID=2784339 RepID=A0A930Y6B9_9ACTN|nr:SDR family oxidoreductase [Nocardioides acrostichi]MBF4160807.1 SDR family oxidoreductase [Nocardioides acrostichi]